MKKVNNFNRLVSQKVYKKCVDAGYTKYSEICVLLDTSDSFVKAVFSEYRKKLNLYHLVRLSYELECSVSDFIPTMGDYLAVYPDGQSEYEYFLMSMEEEE